MGVWQLWPHGCSGAVRRAGCLVAVLSPVHARAAGCISGCCVCPAAGRCLQPPLGVQVAKAESMEMAQRQAQEMIEEAAAERVKVTEAMEREKDNLEKLLASVKEELEYWQSRDKRTEAACNTLQARATPAPYLATAASSSATSACLTTLE